MTLTRHSIETSVDVSESHRVWVWTRSPYTGGGLVVHLALAESADDDGIVQHDAHELAVFTRTTPAHVRRVTAELVDEGLAEVLEPKRGRRPATIALVCLDAPDGTSSGALPRTAARQQPSSTRRAARQQQPVEQSHLFTNEVSEDQDKPTTASHGSTRRAARREPRQHELEARAITERVWQRLDPPPAQRFIAVAKIAEQLLTSFDAQSIEDAMVEVPTISVRWVEARIRGSNPKTQRRDNIDDDRQTPGGLIQL